MENYGSPETVSEAPWAYGIHSCSNTAWIDPYETTSALATQLSPEMGMVPWETPRSCYTELSPDLQPLVGPCLSVVGSALRTSVQACCCYNRCLQNWLGRCVQRAYSLKLLDRTLIAVASAFDQLDRVAGSVAGPFSFVHCFRASTYLSARTALRLLCTSTIKVVYAPVTYQLARHLLLSSQTWLNSVQDQGG